MLENRSKRLVSVLLAVATIAAGLSQFCRAADFSGPLRVCEKNPRYFADDRGQAIFLTGSHTWANLVDMGPAPNPEKFDYDKYIKWMQDYGHNFIRLWAWETVSWNTQANRENKLHVVSPQPWARTGPGKALDGRDRFNLEKFNEQYFKRLRNRVEAAGERGIYVSIMLFEGWAMQFSQGAWEGHPFNKANNVNGIDGDVDGDGKGLEVHELANEKVTAVQEAYVRKVIDTVNDLDNVLYEISNENHPASTQWQYHMIRFIKEYEKTRGKRHPVGMTFQYKGGTNSALFESPADWISPNSDGGYRDNPPAADGRKVVLSDTDHLWGIGGNVDWAWKNFTRGHNVLFMDPYDGEVLGGRFEDRFEALRKALGHIRGYAVKMDLTNARPMNELSSTKYCLARPGREYLVFNPGDSAEIELTLKAGKYAYEWFDTQAGKVGGSGQIDAEEGKKTVKAPFKGHGVLYLTRK